MCTCTTNFGWCHISSIVAGRAFIIHFIAWEYFERNFAGNVCFDSKKRPHSISAPTNSSMVLVRQLTQSTRSTTKPVRNQITMRGIRTAIGNIDWFRYRSIELVQSAFQQESESGCRTFPLRYSAAVTSSVRTWNSSAFKKLPKVP